MSFQTQATDLVDPERNTFPFLKLPAELRNRIYQIHLLPTKELVLDVSDPRQRNRGVNLLRTCKQIYGEGSGLLYSSLLVRYRAQNGTALQDQLEKFAPTLSARIRNLLVTVKIKPNGTITHPQSMWESIHFNWKGFEKLKDLKVVTLIIDTHSCTAKSWNTDPSSSPLLLGLVTGFVEAVPRSVLLAFAELYRSEAKLAEEIYHRMRAEGGHRPDPLLLSFNGYKYRSVSTDAFVSVASRYCISNSTWWKQQRMQWIGVAVRTNQPKTSADH